MDISGLVDLVQALVKNWQGILTLVTGVVIAFGAFLSAVNSLMKFIAPFTPWTWDDNLADFLGKFLANKIFQKK